MYYRFSQNNSGGKYIENKTIKKDVIIKARNDAAAYNKAKKLGLFSLPYCPCCGPRFFPNDYFSYDELNDAINDCRLNHYTGKLSYVVYN